MQHPSDFRDLRGFCLRPNGWIYGRCHRTLGVDNPLVQQPPVIAAIDPDGTRLQHGLHGCATHLARCSAIDFR